MVLSHSALPRTDLVEPISVLGFAIVGEDASHASPAKESLRRVEIVAVR